MTLAINANGETAEAAADGTATMWCESCLEDTLHIRHDEHTLGWMRAVRDYSTHYCESCNDAYAGDYYAAR